MKDEKQLELIQERFYNRFNKFNSEVLKMLGEAVKQFEGLSPSEAHQLAQELKYSTNIDELMNELVRLSGKSISEIDSFFDKVAKENVEVAEQYYKINNKEYIPYKDNIQLQRYVETIKMETYGTFVNLSKSRNIGFTFKDRNNRVIFKPYKQAYRDLIDKAVYNVSTGVNDYQSAMRNTIKQLADSGIKVHEATTAYPSGYNRRIDSSVRQNILTGVRKINIGVQEQVGKEFGANGVEISAHVPCAEDHIPIQGRQYSNKEFEKLNSQLDRPIGEYNCTHFVFSVILGVNDPDYNEHQLWKMRQQSLEKVEYDGKSYTKYEATQVQRKLETSIRKAKDNQIISRASGDKEGIAKAQSKITQLTNKYNDFSKTMNLPTYKNRLTVSGYHRVSTK